MLSEIYDFVYQQPVLVLFLVFSFGYLIGGIKLFGISLGSVGGVLIAGLVFGHYGFTMAPGAQAFGFALFIFCVGYQAGPQFIDVLIDSGLKYLSLALVVAATGFILAVWLANILDLAPGLSAGLMGGAMTTTPTLASAQDAVRSGLVDLPSGFSSEQVLTNIGAGYALTYLFGLIGLILAIRLMPIMLGLDLPSEAAKISTGKDPEAAPDMSKITRRMYRVTKEPGQNKTIIEMERETSKSFAIVSIWRDGKEITIDDKTRFQKGDEVMVIGQVGHLLLYAPELAEEIPIADGQSIPMTTGKVVVSNANVVGKPIKDIRLDEHIAALPLEAWRQRTELPISMDLILHRGDVITFIGPEYALDRLVRHVGYVERDVAETDLFTFALGIAAGIGLGTLSVSVGGISIALGTAGGLLITGLLIGFLRSIYPVFGRVPSASRWVLMELGLLMFMAGVGVNSGAGIVEVIQSAGIKLIGAGILVTLVPVAVGYYFCRKVLKLNPVEALGGITGAMTSGAALKVVSDAAESNSPALSYTGAYAFANVILTVAGTLIMLI